MKLALCLVLLCLFGCRSATETAELKYGSRFVYFYPRDRDLETDLGVHSLVMDATELRIDSEEHVYRFSRSGDGATYDVATSEYFKTGPMGDLLYHDNPRSPFALPISIAKWYRFPTQSREPVTYARSLSPSTTEELVLSMMGDSLFTLESGIEGCSIVRASHYIFNSSGDTLRRTHYRYAILRDLGIVARVDSLDPQQHRIPRCWLDPSSH